MKRKIGTVMVVGAGISGIRAALDLAEVGYGVTLIDRASHIGGILSRLDYQFPTDRCGMCKMLPLVDRDAASQYCLRKGLFHENIDILLSTELAAVDGEPGRYQVTLRQKPTYVDPALCVGCGDCVNVCPVEVTDTFNAGLSKRKAIYLPVPHAVPNAYVIDLAACNRCGACEEVCPTGAVQLSQLALKDFRVLVVDDELIVRDSIKAWLEEEDFAVDMAASGSEALEQLTGSSYQLMLLDIKMPGMDGVEVLKKAKDMFPDLCVVMMTAYATVETAVEAMKIGALDYLVKPFDPESLLPMVLRIYQDVETARGPRIEVGALVLCGGTAYYNPLEGKNTLGYGIYPNVLTSLEFERVLSGTGPNQGRLVRPGDGKPVRKVAWLQCVGSRDIQIKADFCSSVCCMHAIKEAVVAKERAGEDLQAAIFYMDMRTFGKSFQRYRDRAEQDYGIRFERGRIHSVIEDAASGDLILTHVSHTGRQREENFDLVVLSVGQRPAKGMETLAEMVGISLNPWGFGQTEPFSLTRTDREGVVLGGSFSGPKDIGESVIQASAAAFAASRTVHATGGGLAPEPSSSVPMLDVLREPPRVMVAICTCGGRLSTYIDRQQLVGELEKDPAVEAVVCIEQTCTAQGWDTLVEAVAKYRPNRLLVAACLPYVYARKLRELGRKVGLDSTLMDVVDISTPVFSILDETKEVEKKKMGGLMESTLQMGLAGLKWADPAPAPKVKIHQQALVVGGGIAGMIAALAIADHGFQVDLVEQTEHLGGNLKWLQRTLEGNSTETLLKETLLKIEKHPLIRIHIQSRVVSSQGQVGHFYTTVEDAEACVHTLEHGITILAAGGTEAATTSYGYGRFKMIVTQKELEQKMADNTIDPARLNAVVMIQCVDSREEPRNYCSRVCCGAAMKHALHLKSQHSDIAIYILYRDMMTHGFSESYYTQARKAGVIFIPYDVNNKPQVSATEESVEVAVFDPIVGREILIDADLVVLATGVVPNLRGDLAAPFGATLDQDDFFEEAESKWRPVDSLKEGVFACGLALAPRSIAESIATAEAAGMRALRILCREQMPAGKVVAEIHSSLCSLCEQCIEACPYGARILDLDLEKVLINPVMCQGCGSCAAVCPNSASVLAGFSDKQMLDVIDAALVGTI